MPVSARTCGFKSHHPHHLKFEELPQMEGDNVVSLYSQFGVKLDGNNVVELERVHIKVLTNKLKSVKIEI